MATQQQLLDALKAGVAAHEFKRIIEHLNAILAQPTAVAVADVGTFEALLALQCNDVLILTAQTIAELAKAEDNRNCFTAGRVIRQLIPFLSHADQNITLQTCRALGNLCFENDKARIIVGKDGLQALITLMKTTLDVKSFDIKLIAISCGCLMNIIMNNEDLQKAALDCGVLEIMEAILKHNLIDFEANEDCSTHALTVLNLVTEHMIDQWLTQNLCILLVDILKISMNADVSTLCLEILRMQCENDDIKLCLAKKGICELVYELVEKHGSHVNDEESRSVLKMACDLIVLILTGDESMEMLYGDGKGKVYQQMVFWLNSEDVDLLSTGVLAIGNFARKDQHCIQLVENGLAKKLLGILKYYSVDGDTKVQHALLSTLRNLSIPPENKAKLLQENLVETLLSMLNIDQSPVEFKLLGTLRMVVDGQEKTALDLIQRQQFIEKLVHWCYDSDHLGVRGEAPRLLAWMIKNCKSSDSYDVVLGVPRSVLCLVEMMTSMHAVMQNEAMLALNLLCYSCLAKPPKNPDCKSLAQQLLDAEIGKNIKFVIENYHEKMDNETAENLISLLTQIIQNSLLFADCKTYLSAEVLNMITKDERLSAKVQTIIGKLGS